MARLAFFGTPSIAKTCLESLLDAKGHEVVLVVCQPDRKKGRGQHVEPPPTKALATARGLEVLQPSTLKKGTPDGEAFFERFASLGIDLAVVVAYGRIIPMRLLNLPPRGFVNVHASLLPRWRGAAPIQRAIEAGDKETGVCLMHMVPELDAGDVYVREAIPIRPDDDSETLMDRLARLGGKMLLQDIDALAAGRLPRTPQAADGITYASMLEKEEGLIDWRKSARAVVDHVRAMHPWPGASCVFEGEVLKLYGGRVDESTTTGAPPGTVIASKETLAVACGEGIAAFSEAQRPGGKRMPIAALVLGRPIPTGTRLQGRST